MAQITVTEIEKVAKLKISNGFDGNSIVGFVDLLGFSREIMTKWGNPKNDPLFRLIKIKSFVELAIIRAVNHKLGDYNGNIVIQVPYPKVITFSDSFIFLKEIDNDDPNYQLACVLAVIGSIIELWKISLDEGFTIRGGIDYGKIFYTNDDLVGPTLINSYLLESRVAKYSRVIISKVIRSMISDNINKINPVLVEYYCRFLHHDKDNYLSINPLIAFGYINDPLLDKYLYKFKDLYNNANKRKERKKYKDVIKILEQRDRSLLNIAIFSLKDGPNLAWYFQRFLKRHMNMVSKK